jgi:hypothetical protein
MVSNIELEYIKLEEDNNWRDFFQVNKIKKGYFLYLQLKLKKNDSNF